MRRKNIISWKGLQRFFIDCHECTTTTFGRKTYNTHTHDISMFCWASVGVWGGGGGVWGGGGGVGWRGCKAQVHLNMRSKVQEITWTWLSGSYACLWTKYKCRSGVGNKTNTWEFLRKKKRKKSRKYYQWYQLPLFWTRYGQAQISLSQNRTQMQSYHNVCPSLLFPPTVPILNVTLL